MTVPPNKTMKLLLCGYEGSKIILPTSSYLLNKYVPKSFDIYFLNFGAYNGKLFTGEFVSMAGSQAGGKGAWSKYIYEYVSGLKDKYVILGVDDHLINEKVNMDAYRKLYRTLGGNVKSVRLCDCTWYPANQYNTSEDGIMSLKEDADYVVTGQYTLWDRKVLLELLEPERDVWNFESAGSQLYKDKGYRTNASFKPPFKYDTVSALSAGNPKINMNGVKQKDLDFLISNGYLNSSLTI